jgi:hypothetical protein
LFAICHVSGFLLVAGVDFPVGGALLKGDDSRQRQCRGSERSCVSTGIPIERIESDSQNHSRGRKCNPEVNLDRDLRNLGHSKFEDKEDEVGEIAAPANCELGISFKIGHVRELSLRRSIGFPMDSQFYHRERRVNFERILPKLS